MLPVRVKSVSSTPCTLPQASSFLQRFLSSDACSDSFVRGYAASVAQALSGSNDNRRRNVEVTPDRKLTHRISVTSSSAAPPVPVPVSGNGERLDARSNSETGKNDTITKKKKRKRSSLDGDDVGSEGFLVSQSEDQTAQKEVIVQDEHKKKRRKKEEKEKEKEEDRGKAKEKEREKQKRKHEKQVFDGIIPNASNDKASIEAIEYQVEKKEKEEDRGKHEEKRKEEDKVKRQHGQKHKEKQVLDAYIPHGSDGKAFIEAVAYQAENDHSRKTKKVLDLHETEDYQTGSSNKLKKNEKSNEEKDKEKEDIGKEKLKERHKGKHKEKQVLDENIPDRSDDKASIEAVAYQIEKDHDRKAKKALVLHETEYDQTISSKKSKKYESNEEKEKAKEGLGKEKHKEKHGKQDLVGNIPNGSDDKGSIEGVAYRIEKYQHRKANKALDLHGTEDYQSKKLKKKDKDNEEKEKKREKHKEKHGKKVLDGTIPNGSDETVAY